MTKGTKRLKIISGGQNGADRTALEVARERGVETGGVAPLGYRTLSGCDYSLRRFGLIEHSSPTYPPRTEANVKMAGLTVWFGKINTRGYLCTRKAAIKLGRPFKVNPTAVELAEWLQQYEVVNIAGNAPSNNPGIQSHVREVLGTALTLSVELTND